RADFPDGVQLVALAPLADPALLAAALAGALGVAEAGGAPLPTCLTAGLRDKRALVVLDNCEHLLAAMGLVAELLAACPGLARLEPRLALLTGGPQDAPARQRTLRATLDWSHALLAPAERALFARLAVFAGGGTLDAIAAICAPAEGGDADPLAGVDALVRAS